MKGEEAKERGMKGKKLGKKKISKEGSKGWRERRFRKKKGN